MAEVSRWFAPGRVNLIGEHLDYNGGPVLPMAIDRGVTAKFRSRNDDEVHVWTTFGGGSHGSFALGAGPGDVDGWLSYVAEVFWALRDAGHTVCGFDIVIDSDLPAGAGLSSSAALECVVAGALNELCSLGMSKQGLARVAHRAETDFTGVPCGSMDQITSMCGAEGHALFLSGAGEPIVQPEVRPVSAGWAADGLTLLVIDTNVRRSLLDGDYDQRRTECADAARILGLKHLAEAGPDAILRLEDETLKKRTSHVITETARVRGASRALGAGNWDQLGRVLTASHESLRDDFAVSCMELDIAVSAAIEAGALGARMTGAGLTRAGFGGCAIALMPTDRVAAVTERVTAALTHMERAAPTCFVAKPAAGMRRLPAETNAASSAT